MSNSAINSFDEANTLLLQARRIVIVSHKNPDADSIGANLALREGLEGMGKQVLSACVDAPPESCHFLLGVCDFVQDFQLSDFDLVVSVDCGGHKLMAFHERKPELLDRKRVSLVNIDHHPSNDFFGNVNVVMPEAPATCFILFFMFSYWGWNITRSMATSLLHGLYYDTACFMNSNTTADSYRVAARLKALGGDHERCVKEQFHSSSINKLRLWGRALERAQANEKNAIVTAITEADLVETETKNDDISGLVSYLNHVPTAKFCLLLAEDRQGNIKGSMRTQDPSIDLAAIAGLWGGGGHGKAAGFTIPGHLVEKRTWSIV